MNNMDKHSNESYTNYQKALHKPHITFNPELECYQCSDGGLTFFGRTANEAHQELMSVRN